MAVESFDAGLGNGSPADGLVRVIQEANRKIHDRSRSDEQAAGMGTTCTAAYVGESEVTIAHVGDSRAYLWRDGELTRLTRDHSLVGELVARGKLTEEQAEAHPQRSVITRALGPEREVQVDVGVLRRPRRRRLPAVLGRPDLDDPRGGRAARDRAHGPSLDHTRPRADRRGQRGRRARQHHRDPVPPRGGRRRRRHRRRRGPDGGAARRRPGDRQLRHLRGRGRARPAPGRLAPVRAHPGARRGDHARGRRRATPCAPATRPRRSTAPAARSRSRRSSRAREADAEPEIAPKRTAPLPDGDRPAASGPRARSAAAGSRAASWSP